MPAEKAIIGTPKSTATLLVGLEDHVKSNTAPKRDGLMNFLKGDRLDIPFHRRDAEHAEDLFNFFLCRPLNGKGKIIFSLRTLRLERSGRFILTYLPA